MIGKIVDYYRDVDGRERSFHSEIYLANNGDIYNPDTIDDPDDPKAGVLCKLEELSFEVVNKFGLVFDSPTKIFRSLISDWADSVELQKKTLREIELIRKVMEAALPFSERKDSDNKTPKKL